MTEKKVYKPLEDLSNQQLNEILDRNRIYELIPLPLSVGEYHINWKYAQDLCAKLSEHENPLIRANAILGFAYIARTKGMLEKHIVKPIVLKELRDNQEYNWRIIDAIHDINLFMKWKIGANAIKE
ncbi:hypothetical protein F7984_04790 [Pradoshia sp. D12]|uniref:hypothetical protein n=1 Tax=Bacillaceae TaxID=186817 RepID=UPI00080AF732|nr:MULTISPECIES: hypothetical protein [Bacillaceae]OCA83461.1 hypothetical protein A8L44_11530 [Bacillus sp. FJAT-27986]QFK70604.1 hypothetical protein F7984_04790 [Pradoshia sp. D12]TPF72399.1 hypothetical protein FHY44_01185 [Bacillus sp. D12]